MFDLLEAEIGDNGEANWRKGGRNRRVGSRNEGYEEGHPAIAGHPRICQLYSYMLYLIIAIIRR